MGYTYLNSYFRSFKISDFVSCNTLQIDSVYFAVDWAYSQYNVEQPVIIKLYSLNGSTLRLANLTLIDSVFGTIPNVDSTIFNVPFDNASIDGNSTLVVSVTSLDGAYDGNLFLIGSNSLGETAPSYMYAPDCGITDITPISSLNPASPMDIVMYVFGHTNVETPDPFINPTNPVCENTSGVAYSVPAVSGLDYTWHYSGSGVTIHNNSGHTATLDFAPGATSGTLSVAASDGSVTSGPRTLSITVNPRPAATISRNGNELSTGNFAAYAWYRNNQPINGATANTYTVAENGDYFVKVSSSNGCSNNSDTIHIDDLETRISDPAGHLQAISVYPNPVHDVLNIKCAFPVNIALSGIDGKLLFSGEDVKRINLSPLAKGIYFLSISDSKGRFLKVEKIVKAR